MAVLEGGEGVMERRRGEIGRERVGEEGERWRVRGVILNHQRVKWRE